MKENCSEVTLYDFIRCVFHQDYSVLSYEKKMHSPREIERLKERWELIYEEYCKISEVPQYTSILEALNEIIRLQKIIYHASAAVTVLLNKYSINDVNALRELGFNYKFDITKPDEYFKDLESVKSKLKSFDLQLNIQLKKVEEKKKDSEKTVQIESDFMEGVAMVSQSQGFRISIKETTLLEWSGMVKFHNKLAEKSRKNG